MSVQQSKILTPHEIRTVVRYLQKRVAIGSERAWQNLVIFRLSVGCGLRASEITNLAIQDIHVNNGERPNVQVRNGKGGRNRVVPLWWDKGTLEDIKRWKHGRERSGAQPEDRFLLSEAGTPMNHKHIWRKWKSALFPLGDERRREIRHHDGRHAFGSYAVQHHSLVAVRDAMGHQSIGTTSIYLHVIEEDDGQIQEMWKT